MNKIFALAVCTVALTASSAAQGQGQAIRKAKKPIRSQYVVVVNSDADPDAVGNESAARFRGRLRHVYRAALRGFSVTLSEQAAATLAEDPRVRFVEEDAEFELAQLQANPPWGLDRIDQRALPLDQTYTYGVPQPKQVTVHVIDTGIRVSHHEFAGRAYIAGDYVDDDRDGDPNDTGNDDADPTRPDGQDCHGHGTHVAGTIAGINAGVAKNAIIQAHRVFTCTGTSTLSGLLAAIDAVTDSPARPAVANMSLGGGASSALDAAVQASIAAGVTYTIAAGNSNVDASTTSPARVTEAITVGATASNDSRSSFSNWGAALDLFAPGSSVLSASYASDTAMTTMSGTSMAAPHVAGVAAAYLERNPTATPAQVRNALVIAATAGKVIGAGTGSPNLLLYSGFLNTSTVTVALTTPDGGERIYTATPYTIQWDVTGGAQAIARFDVLFAADGINYAAVAGCSNLAATARSCVWTVPGPATTNGRMRIVAVDYTGQGVVDTSASAVSVYSGAAVITVTAPNTLVNWGRGSTQQVRWSHNLGTNSFVRIDVSRDGGATFTETIAPAVRNTSSSSGVYDWQVTGPNSATAVVRVSWTNGPTSDVSNVAFTVAEPFITAGAPSSTATNWAYDTVQGINWTSNLGPFDKVTVSLSTDGITYSPQATNLAAPSRAVYITVPTLAAPTAAARVRVSWSNPPAGIAAAGLNPVVFKIAPGFVTVATPNGGNIWTVGTTQWVKWTTNLPKTETVDIQLSKDGGQTWTTVRAATPCDTAEAFMVDPAWVTETGRIRIVWTRNPTASHISNANFAIR